MAGNKSNTAAKKSKDKWKAKEWYNIHAPRMFNETVVGETPAADPELLIGRQVEVTVQELNDDFSKMHIKVIFSINNVDGHEAKTEFIGHSLTSEYVRRLTRRKKTKTDHVVDVNTADGYVLRIKTMSIADRRIQASQEEAMRGKIKEFLEAYGASHKLAEIIKDIVITGDLAKETAKACHVIVPIKRIEIRKTEVLRKGEGEPESIVAAPKAEEPEAPAEAPAAEEPAAEEAPAEEPAEEQASE